MNGQLDPIIVKMDALERENKKLRAMLEVQLFFRWSNVTAPQEVPFVRRVALRTMVGHEQLEVSWGIRVDEYKGFYPGELSGNVARYKEQADYELRRAVAEHVVKLIEPAPPGIWEDLTHLDKKR